MKIIQIDRYYDFKIDIVETAVYITLPARQQIFHVILIVKLKIETKS